MLEVRRFVSRVTSCLPQVVAGVRFTSRWMGHGVESGLANILRFFSGDHRGHWWVKLPGFGARPVELEEC